MINNQVRPEQHSARFVVPQEKSNEPLRECVREALTDYLNHLNGHAPAALYDLVLQEVEQPLLSTVMQHTGGNQSRAADILGISRSTLRKKLAKYGIE